MAKISFIGLAHSYRADEMEENWALKPIDLELQTGGAYGLVGPSGCGKTTILNIISGLIKPRYGKVLFDGEDFTNLPVQKRNVAQVFQFPTIYKSMTVYENLAFPLICRNWEEDKIKARVGDIAEQIGLSGKLNKSANKLGADEKQIVSLGRGLVRDDVTALLMDEPLTVIDPQLKFDLRKRIKQIVKGKNVTIIYVTHDQNEAMTFADELLVMSLGKLVQRGTPEELFERPNSRYVGHFIGSPAMNFIPAKVSQGVVKIGESTFQTSNKLRDNLNSSVDVGIRPEYVKIGSGNSSNSLMANYHDASDMGPFRILNCSYENTPIKLKVPREYKLPSVGKINLEFPPEKLLTYHDGELI